MDEDKSYLAGLNHADREYLESCGEPALQGYTAANCLHGMTMAVVCLILLGIAGAGLGWFQ